MRYVTTTRRSRWVLIAVDCARRRASGQHIRGLKGVSQRVDAEIVAGAETGQIHVEVTPEDRAAARETVTTSVRGIIPGAVLFEQGSRALTGVPKPLGDPRGREPTWVSSTPRSTS